MTKIVYIGNDKWHSCLESLLHANGLVIVHVFIPNNSSFIKKICIDNNLNYTITENINDNYDLISNLKFDIYLVIGHPFLLRDKLLKIKSGIGFHPSLLPKRRGRAPINWAIIDGLKESGVSLFHLDKGSDSGNLIFQEKFKIDEEDTSSNLIDKISFILVNNLKNILLSWPDIPSISQNEDEATYTIRRRPKDGEIRKDMTSLEAERLVRALNGPYPSAFIVMKNGERLYINEASTNEYKD